MFRTFVAIPSVFCRQSLERIVNAGRATASLTSFPRTMSSSSSSSGEPTPAQDAELKVLHDSEQQKFFIPLGENTDVEAVIQYAPTSKGSVDLWHTGVPPEFRGKGVAKLLAQAALDHFSSQKTRMLLSCTYLQRHAKLFPQPEHEKYIVTE